jgi:hypothetical protein
MYTVTINRKMLMILKTALMIMLDARYCGVRE